MKNIEIIKYCLDAYKKALHSVDIPDFELEQGVCQFLKYDLNINFNQSKKFYWIQRNISYGDIYWCKPGLLLTRVQILQKEYDHHKKWGFLARWIKP